jgi:hypothetical protein
MRRTLTRMSRQRHEDFRLVTPQRADRDRPKSPRLYHQPRSVALRPGAKPRVPPSGKPGRSPTVLMRSCRSLRLRSAAAHSCTVQCVVYVAYMGRRSRELQQRRQERERVRTTRDRMARVCVSDETWSAYRAVLGSTPVSVALGKLVEREVAAHRRRTALDADGVREAVRDARLVADELASLIVRLERSNAVRSGSAAPPGSSAEKL